MPLTQKVFTSGSECPKLEPGTLRLYSMRLCPYAQRSRLVLAHKNIQHETVNIHLKQKPEWYLANINPLGMVPSLQKDDKIVYDSAIVCDYLDEVYPENKLTPTDPYQRARDRMLAEMWSKVLGPFYRLFRVGGEDADGTVIPALWSALAVFETELKNRKTQFFGGDSVMMIDYLLWPHMERIDAFQVLKAELKMCTKTFPHLSSWVERMKTVPAVKETLTAHALYTLIFESVKTGQLNYDLGLE